MSRPDGHAEQSANADGGAQSTTAVSRTMVLLILAGAIGAGGLLAGMYQPDAVDQTDATRDPILLSVSEPQPEGHATETVPEKSSPSDSSESPAEVEQVAIVSPEAVTDESSGENAASSDERLQELILGTWQQSYYGKRLLTVLPDGKATMVIRPDSVWAFAFGQQIDLDMFWKIEDGRIDYGYKSGTPKDKVKLAAKTWGDHWDEKILELTDTRLVLLGEDGVTRSEWDRASTSKTPAVSKDRSAVEPR